MPSAKCARRGCKRTVRYNATLVRWDVDTKDRTRIYSTVMQRWDLCAEDRDRVQTAMNTAIEEVEKI